MTSALPRGKDQRDVVRGPSCVLFACFLVAVAATPYAGDYWALTLLSVLVILDVARARRPVVLPWGLVVVLLWFAMSGVWSVAPSLTARNGVLTFLLTIAAASMARALGPAVTLRALLAACRVLLVASWALYVLAPSVGRAQEVYQTGAFEGVFVQRNVAAFFCVVAVLGFLTASTGRVPGVGARSSVGWAAAAMATLVLTSSSTGLAVLLACMGVLGLLILASKAGTVRRRRALVGAAVIFVLTLALWLPYNLSSVSELFGRDSTLTGRSVIWSVVEGTFFQAPWQGYGYGALWTAGVPLTESMWAQVGFPFYHAHSAYWDYLAQVGAIGLTSILVVLLLGAGRAIVWLVRERAPVAIWSVGICICLMFYGVSEESFASQFGWILFVLVVTVTGVGESRKRLDDELPDPRRLNQGVRAQASGNRPATAHIGLLKDPSAGTQKRRSGNHYEE